METLTFQAIGTHWSIGIDEPLKDRKALEEKILHVVNDFEAHFSRFLPESEVNAFAGSTAGVYPVSPLFAHLLSAAQELRTLTGGVFDPAVAGLLERAGYDAAYRLRPDNSEITAFTVPKWSVSGDLLTIDGPIRFDLGGIGKGYAIDMVAALLREEGYHYYIVEAGGDMVATTKHSGEGWRVALEWPGKPDIAAGLVILRDQGLAVSDSFRRRWGNWHHLVDPFTKQPITRIIGVAAVTPSAWNADRMTSVLFMAKAEDYSAHAHTFSAQYLVFRADGEITISPNWSGELYM